MTRYMQPTSRRVEDTGLSFLWCLLFGPLWMALRGIWGHFVVSLVLALMTGGISWLFYPFLAHGILCRSYERRGWRRIS